VGGRAIKNKRGVAMLGGGDWLLPSLAWSHITSHASRLF